MTSPAKPVETGESPERGIEPEEVDLPNIVLDDELYAKAKGLLKMAVGNVLKVFDMYGMGAHIGQAQDEIVRLAEDFGLAVRGIDEKPISIEYIRRDRA